MAQAIPVNIGPVSLNLSEKVTACIGDRTIAEELTAGVVNDENTVDLTLTSAQLLAIPTSANGTTIINAPLLNPTVGNPSTVGAAPGYAIIVNKVVAYLKATATGYAQTSAAGLSIRINSVEMARLPFTGFLDQTADTVAVAALEAPAAVGLVVKVNSPVGIVAITNALTTGTGTLSLRIFYSLVPANF